MRTQGVVHRLTAPYNTEMSGSADRINSTVLNMVRAMMGAVAAPKPLWGEAAKAAAMIHNVTSVAGQPNTPWEMVFKVKSDVTHLRVWGAPAYIHEPNQLRRKLDSKAAKGILVGYEVGYKSCRVLGEGRIRVSKSVVVDEAAVLPLTTPAAAMDAQSRTLTAVRRKPAAPHQLGH
ncbi:hypothetical protein QJQ45_010710 [Haematococcus lacustris]|nr:hypothetical protein QJQ45_010710 [Haematococcus lacustris]